jgi:hypothetical protein
VVHTKGWSLSIMMLSLTITFDVLCMPPSSRRVLSAPSKHHVLHQDFSHQKRTLAPRERAAIPQKEHFYRAAAAFTLWQKGDGLHAHPGSI